MCKFCGKKRELSDYFFVEKKEKNLFCKVKQVKNPEASQRPSMAFTKIYSHIIETLPSKLETQHGMHRM